jgi:hypothetical protein
VRRARSPRGKPQLSAGERQASAYTGAPPPLPPSRTNWTRLVPPSRTNWTRRQASAYTGAGLAEVVGDLYQLSNKPSANGSSGLAAGGGGG